MCVVQVCDVQPGHRMLPHVREHHHVSVVFAAHGQELSRALRMFGRVRKGLLHDAADHADRIVAQADTIFVYGHRNMGLRAPLMVLDYGAERVLERFDAVTMRRDETRCHGPHIAHRLSGACSGT